MTTEGQKYEIVVFSAFSVLMLIASRLPRVRACLFDMDGLLIDSEDIYTLTTNLILQEYDKPNLPWVVKAQLQGRPQFEVKIYKL